MLKFLKNILTFFNIFSYKKHIVLIYNFKKTHYEKASKEKWQKQLKPKPHQSKENENGVFKAVV